MTTDDRRGTAVPWSLLVLLLVTNVPLFLCMPLTDDAAMFDLQAGNLLAGGVLYRDIVEPNLPGVIWIQAVVRATLGTSPLALRAVDLLWFSVFVALCRHWLASSGATRAAQAWLVFVLLVCYFSLSEWCHCQRDVWLLVPGLAGLILRCRQIERPRTVRWSFLEGLCWGAGVWLKPMIVLPAVCCWVFSVLCIRNWRRAVADAVGLLAGGLAAGGLGAAWLAWSGAWPYFVATLLDWNPGYVAAGREQWTWARYVAMQVRFFPWQLLHVAAIPVALVAVGRGVKEGWKSRKVEESKSERVEESRGTGKEPADFSTSRLFDASTFPLFHSSSLPLLSVFYLAWLLQSHWLQHLFDYVHAPGLLLAVVVLGTWAEETVVTGKDKGRVGDSAGKSAAGAQEPRGFGWRALRLAFAAFAVLVLLTSPVIDSKRLSCWWKCVAEGSTSEVRDRLKFFSVPNWTDLDRVAQYLRAQDVRDGELTCYHNSLVHLYGILGFNASTRYVYLEQVVAYFPSRRQQFLRALSDSRQRFVVTDLIASGLSPSGIARLGPVGALAHPPRFPARLRDVYPWSQPAVFRAGPYLVHRVEPPLGRLEGGKKRDEG